MKRVRFDDKTEIIMDQGSTGKYRSRSLPRNKRRVQYKEELEEKARALREHSILQSQDYVMFYNNYYNRPLRWQGQSFYPAAFRVPKALLVTFYINGDLFFPGIKVSIRRGKDFHSFGALCDYLTQRLKVTYGVRYIFNLRGKIIKRLEELQDGDSYVVSSNRLFQDIAYGVSARMRTAYTGGRPTLLREDDLRLLRPVTPVHLRRPVVNRIGRYSDQSGVYNSRGSDLSIRSRASLNEYPAAYKEGRILTVVNGNHHEIRSRVLLNLRTTKNFEGVLKDLGQAIRLDHPTRMYTPWGQEVLSFSQLKNDFGDVETFYLDDIDNRAAVLVRSPPPPLPPISTRSPEPEDVNSVKNNFENLRNRPNFSDTETKPKFVERRASISTKPQLSRYESAPNLLNQQDDDDEKETETLENATVTTKAAADETTTVAPASEDPSNENST